MSKTENRDRCVGLLVEAMLGCVEHFNDLHADTNAIRAAMRVTAESFLDVWDNSKAFGGRLIVDEARASFEEDPAPGCELFLWVRGRAAEPGESTEGLREFRPGPTPEGACYCNDLECEHRKPLDGRLPCRCCGEPSNPERTSVIRCDWCMSHCQISTGEHTPRPVEDK